MLLDRAVLVNLFSRSNSQKQARKSGGHVGEFNRTDPTIIQLQTRLVLPIRNDHIYAIVVVLVYVYVGGWTFDIFLPYHPKQPFHSQVHLVWD